MYVSNTLRCLLWFSYGSFNTKVFVLGEKIMWVFSGLNSRDPYSYVTMDIEPEDLPEDRRERQRWEQGETR